MPARKTVADWGDDEKKRFAEAADLVRKKFAASIIPIQAQVTAIMDTTKNYLDIRMPEWGPWRIGLARDKSGKDRVLLSASPLVTGEYLDLTISIAPGGGNAGS